MLYFLGMAFQPDFISWLHSSIFRLSPVTITIIPRVSVIMTSDLKCNFWKIAHHCKRSTVMWHLLSKKSHTAWLTICFVYTSNVFNLKPYFLWCPKIESNCEIINVIWSLRRCNEEKKADFCWSLRLKLNFTSSHGCQLTGFVAVQTRMWCKAGHVSGQDRQVTGGRRVVTGVRKWYPFKLEQLLGWQKWVIPNCPKSSCNLDAAFQTLAVQLKKIQRPSAPPRPRNSKSGKKQFARITFKQRMMGYGRHTCTECGVIITPETPLKINEFISAHVAVQIHCQTRTSTQQATDGRDPNEQMLDRAPRWLQTHAKWRCAAVGP